MFQTTSNVFPGHGSLREPGTQMASPLKAICYPFSLPTTPPNCNAIWISGSRLKPRPEKTLEVRSRMDAVVREGEFGKIEERKGKNWKALFLRL